MTFVSVVSKFLKSDSCYFLYTTEKKSETTSIFELYVSLHPLLVISNLLLWPSLQPHPRSSKPVHFTWLLPTCLPDALWFSI